jgi:hypothetical protein
MKYWVSDLSSNAQTKLLKKIKSNLKADGLEPSAINKYLKDVKNEKLGSLDYHVSHSEMVKLSNMK